MSTIDAIKKTLADRHAVAMFAMYWMGSALGDFAPATVAIYERVMLDDKTYEFYRSERDKAERESDSFIDEFLDSYGTGGGAA